MYRLYLSIVNNKYIYKYLIVREVRMNFNRCLFKHCVSHIKGIII